MKYPVTNSAEPPSIAPDATAATASPLRAGADSEAASWMQAWRTLGASQAARQTNGPFAVALEDGPTRSMLAVDRFAVRSACYRFEDGVLRSSLRATDLGSPDEIDPQAIFDYLFFHCIPSPRTIFKGVRRLPAAHVAVAEQGRLDVQPYWVPDFSTGERARAPSFDELKAEFRDHLQRAVGQLLDGGTPACFLSGGTDSSTVAGMIREASGRAAHSYSIGFEAEGYDEMAYARIAARHFGCEHHEYYVTPQDLVQGIPAVAAAYDQPFGNSSALPAYYCALKARQDGVTTMLAGDGGDELFGGNSRYAKQRVFGWYGMAPQWLRRGVLEPLLDNPIAARLPILKKGASYVEQARVPMPDRLQMYNLLLRLGVREVLSGEFLAQVDAREPARHQREVWGSALAASELNRTLAYDWRYTLAESDLPKVCGTTALAGVKVGFPFLDQALVDFSMRLPVDYKLKGMKLRWFFKEALRGFLPDEILTKRKQGFGLPFGVWLTRHEPLMRFAADSLNGFAERGVVRPEFVRQLLNHLLHQHPGYYGEMVWILMMLEQWLRHHAPQWRLSR